MDFHGIVPFPWQCRTQILNDLRRGADPIKEEL